MEQITSIFTGWKKQCFDWTTDYAGAADITQHLYNTLGQKWYKQQRVLDFTQYMCTREQIDKAVKFWSKRSLVHEYCVGDYPENVLIYANDIKRMTIEDFLTIDLEYLFGLEFIANIGEEN